MSSSTSSFRTVMRGYDPAEVDAHIATLKEHAKELRHQISEVEDRLKAVTEPNFTHLGDRVGQILALAEEEAAELRKKARKEADATRQDAADAARRLRKEADTYSTTTRTEADEYAAVTRAEAEQHSHVTRADADQYADTTRAAAEAEAAKIVQAARDEAAAVQAAAEKDLADVRAEHERAVTEIERDLAARRATVEEIRVKTDRIERERTEEARRQALAIVTQAKDGAAGIRVQAEHDLAELQHRHDSLNAQLMNVRRVLAAMTGETDGPEQGELFEASPDRP